MFQKVLIVDDHDVVNEGVLTMLHNNGIKNVCKVQYCDEAYLKAKKAYLDNSPFDLLITDLSFKADHRESKLISGEDLVAALRPDYPNLSIIVYSMEDRLQKVRTLINKHAVNAYVCKGRKGAVELAQAITHIYDKKIFLSPQVKNALSPKTNLEFNDYDMALVKQLSLGLSQSEISTFFKNNNTKPSSLSAVEKQLNKLKDQFKANNATHLVAIIKDLGLI